MEVRRGLTRGTETGPGRNSSCISRTPVKCTSMIIYGSSMSPFVRKTLAFAAEKGLAVENKAWRGDPDPDFLVCSPMRKIPALRDGDFTIADSTAIITYLDALHPEPNLIPVEPRARARTIWWEEFADTLLAVSGSKMFFNRIVGPKFRGVRGDEAIAAKAEREEMPPLFDHIEQVLPASGHLVEDRLTLADLAVASPFANFRHLGLDLARWPKVTSFAEAILSRPSFAAYVAKETQILSR